MNTIHPMPVSKRRRRVFIGLAVLTGLVLVGLAEFMCRMVGWGEPAVGQGAALNSGHSVNTPLFELDASGSRYSVRRDRLRFFVPESFPARKSPGTFRIFCVGGSTVQGRPWSKETSFTTWLRLALEAAEPDRTWEVINCGGVSYGSGRLVPIVEECLGYEPDLMLVCTGHNEFLEDESFGQGPEQASVAGRVSNILRRSHLYGVMRQGNSQWTWTGRSGVTPGVELPPASAEADQADQVNDVDALLDYRDGLKAYHRDEAWQKRVEKDFEINLTRMTARTQQAGVPLWLMRPPSNLADCPPFKSEHRAGMSRGEMDQWERLMAEAGEWAGKDLNRSVALLRRALELDAMDAATHYELGKCLEALGQREPARASFLRARELDVCPLRMPASLELVMKRVGADADVPVVDLHAWLEERSEWNILGGDWLVDHVHPSIRGQQLIAERLVDEMALLDWVRPGEGWAKARDEKYQAQFNALDALYFARGQQRLENLRAWTQGNADGPPLGMRGRGIANCKLTIDH